MWSARSGRGSQIVTLVVLLRARCSAEKDSPIVPAPTMVKFWSASFMGASMVADEEWMRGEKGWLSMSYRGTQMEQHTSRPEVRSAGYGGRRHVVIRRLESAELELPELEVVKLRGGVRGSGKRRWWGRYSHALELRVGRELKREACL